MIEMDKAIDHMRNVIAGIVGSSKHGFSTGYLCGRNRTNIANTGAYFRIWRVFLFNGFQIKIHPRE
jgi:hypothetical protein